MHDQGVQIGSRYLWDADRDNFAAASFHNRHIFADGSVYALYYEWMDETVPLCGAPASYYARAYLLLAIFFKTDLVNFFLACYHSKSK